MRRNVGLEVDDLLRSVATSTEHDAVSERILDSAAELFERLGVRRCSMEDIADHCGVGRTTIYRRFEGRDDIVHAVLGREVRRFFSSILLATQHHDRFADIVVESFLQGLRANEASLLATLVRNEPDLLALLTIAGGPVVEAARDFLVAAYGPLADPHDATLVAMVGELLIRLAISLVITPGGVITNDDPVATRESLHRLLDPILDPLADLRTA